MRDPTGYLRLEGDRAVRQLADPLPASAFLRHAVARRLVDAGALVPFELSSADERRIESPRYPFVSLPTEWTDAQLRAAADLTLDISERVLAHDFELKDASAWNVIFDGCVPRFCDHLSFEAIASRQWWAFGQFCRHFTFPLACSRWRGMQARTVFQIQRDGLGAEQARTMLGMRGRLSRLAPLLLRRAVTAADDSRPAVLAQAGGKAPLHQSLIDYARSSLLGPAGVAAAQTSAWRGYVDERLHYPPEAVGAKLTQVGRWLVAIAPRTVLDLGCNTGEFSRLALEWAQRVISVDADHDCVQRLFQESAGDTRIHPLVVDLCDLRGGRGWAGAEFPGFLERLVGQADTSMMLALIHHLHVSEGIPLLEIAAFAARITTEHLIVELLASDDPMVQRLAAQRRRAVEEFTIDNQLAAFARHFDLVDRVPLGRTRRELVLLRLKA